MAMATRFVVTQSQTHHYRLLTHHRLHIHETQNLRFRLSAANQQQHQKQQWGTMTAQFSGSSSLPFLLLHVPQIALNSRNLSAGDAAALLAVPWLSVLTGLLGNLSLLSYFTNKREKEVMAVQTLAVVSRYTIFAQLAAAGAMELPFFAATSVVVAAGLALSFLNYFRLLRSPSVWLLWEDFIAVGGLSVLPQVMWSTFTPYLPSTFLPGAVSFVVALTAVILARTGKLSEKGVKFVGAISGWTATLLFMWMPVSQMWTNVINPNNIRGMSSISMLLAMIGNGLLIPRALFTRDLMWFVGACWASFFYGYGNLVCLYWFKIISSEFFLAATLSLLTWIGVALWRDTVVHGHSTPLTSLRELVSGS